MWFPYIGRNSLQQGSFCDSGIRSNWSLVASCIVISILKMKGASKVVSLNYRVQTLESLACVQNVDDGWLITKVLVLPCICDKCFTDWIHEQKNIDVIFPTFNRIQPPQKNVPHPPPTLPKTKRNKKYMTLKKKNYTSSIIWYLYFNKVTYTWTIAIPRGGACCFPLAFTIHRFSNGFSRKCCYHVDFTGPMYLDMDWQLEMCVGVGGVESRRKIKKW